MHESGSDISIVKLPAVLTVLKDVNIPRIPSLRGRLHSRKIDITIWDEKDLDTDPDKIGLGGSPTRVVSTRKPDARDKHTIILNGSAVDSARELMKILKTRIEL